MTHIKIDDKIYTIPDEVAIKMNEYARYGKDVTNLLLHLQYAAESYRTAVKEWVKTKGYDEKRKMDLAAIVLDKAIDIQIAKKENKAA